MHRSFLAGACVLLLVVAPGFCAEETVKATEKTEAAPKTEVTEKTEATEQTEAKLRTPDVIFVPTPRRVVRRMLRLAAVKQSDLVYDLGCGDGRIVVEAAKRHGCRAMGFDIDPKRVKASLANVKKNKVEHLVKIEHKDIFQLDLSEANVVTLYLLPELNVKLIPQLEKLKPGSRIVSHDFDMRGVKPDKVVKVKAGRNGSEHKIYMWTTPLKKEEQTEEEETEEDETWEEAEQEAVQETVPVGAE